MVFGVPISKHYLYHTFHGIVNRCDNKNSQNYHRYGGRGITYDESWRKKPKKFIEDIINKLGDRPSPKHSLDRIDNNGNYVIGNLRWATQKEQVTNRPEGDALINCLDEQGVDYREILAAMKKDPTAVAAAIAALKAALAEPNKVPNSIVRSPLDSNLPK